MGKDKDKEEELKKKKEEEELKKEEEEELERIYLLNKLYYKIKNIISNRLYYKTDFLFLNDYIKILDTNDKVILNLHKFLDNNMNNFMNLYYYLKGIKDIECVKKIIEYFS